MTTTKSIMSVTGIAFALMFGGGVYLLMNINHFAKDYIEKVATQTLGVQVTIGALDVDLKALRAQARNLRIKNAPDFQSPYILRARTLDVGLDSVSKTLVHLKVIDVQGVQTWMDIRPSGTNFQAVQKNVTSASRKSPQDAEAVKIIIDRLSLRDMSMNTSIEAVGAVNKLEVVRVPDVSLKGIGKRENGVIVQDAIAQVWRSLSKKVIAAGPQKTFMKDLETKAVDKVRGVLGNVFGE